MNEESACPSTTLIFLGRSLLEAIDKKSDTEQVQTDVTHHDKCGVALFFRSDKIIFAHTLLGHPKEIQRIKNAKKGPVDIRIFCPTKADDKEITEAIASVFLELKSMCLRDQTEIDPQQDEPCP